MWSSRRPSARRRYSVDRRRSRRPLVETLEPRQVMAALTVGGVTGGSIGSVGEVDLLTFNAPAGARIDLVMSSVATSGDFRAFAELFDPGNNRVTFFRFDDGNQRIDLPDLGGTYTLRVTDQFDDATGNYAVGMESIRPASPSPASLNIGGIVGGTIGHRLEKDQFVFSGEALTTYDFLLTSQRTAGDFRAFAELFGPSGIRHTFFRFDDGNQRITLPDETGDYVLMVYDQFNDARGTYTIGVEVLDPISPGPLPLPYGVITNNQIGNRIEKDQFVFQASALSTIELVMTRNSAGGDFKPFAELFAPSGLRHEFFRFDDGSQRITLPEESGNYMLMVYDQFNDGVGKYSIGLEGINPISPAPIPLVKGGITGGSTFRTIEKDQYTFTADALSTIELVMTSSSKQGDFRAFAELFAPSGQRQTFFRFDDGNQRITLPDESGVYTLLVYDQFLDAIGNYSIGLESIKPASPNPRDLVRNQVTSGAINNVIEKDQFLLRGVNNETIEMELSSVATDAGFLAFAQLFAPSGDLVRQWRVDDGRQAIPLTGFGTGNYVLQVRSFDLASRGTYTVDFTGNVLPAGVNAPSNLRTVAVSDTSVDLAWTQHSSNEVGFQVAVSFDQGESFVTVGTTTINDTTFTVGGLIPGQRYRMKVRAFTDNNVSLYSNTIDVVTRLTAPTNLRTGILTSDSVQLLWNDNSNNESRFEIFRRLGTSGAFTKIGTSAANSTSFNATGLTAGTLYQFQVRAVNNTSFSNRSNTLSATTPAAAPLVALGEESDDRWSRAIDDYWSTQS